MQTVERGRDFAVKDFVQQFTKQEFSHGEDL